MLCLVLYPAFPHLHVLHPFTSKAHCGKNSTLHILVGNYMLNTNSPNVQFRISTSTPLFKLHLLEDDSLTIWCKTDLVFSFCSISESLTEYGPMFSVLQFFTSTFSLTFLTFKETALNRCLCLNIWASSSGDTTSKRHTTNITSSHLWSHFHVPDTVLSKLHRYISFNPYPIKPNQTRCLQSPFYR